MKTESKTFTELAEDVRKAESSLSKAHQRASAASFTAMVQSMETNRLRAEAAREKGGVSVHGPLIGSQVEAEAAERERADFAHQIEVAETALQTAKDAQREALSTLWAEPVVRIEIKPKAMSA